VTLARAWDPESPGPGADAAFAGLVAGFFAARLRGPVEARAAVLATLEAGAPYPLVQIASAAGPALGAARDSSRRLGLLAEVLRAGLGVCLAAYRQDPLPERFGRAMRVLVADTLLTFTWEVAADLPDPGGDSVRRLLAKTVGAEGFLGALTSSGGPRTDPERAASVFLGGALLELAAAAVPERPLDPGLVFEIRIAASLAERGPVGVLLPDGTIPPRLDHALAVWRAFSAEHAAAGGRARTGRAGRAEGR